MLKKNKMSAYMVMGIMGLAGLVAGVAGIAGAQSVATTPTPTSQGAAVQSSSDTRPHGHAPLGGDGVVSSINGTTIVIGEEADEGGASYTVDASKATVTNNGATASLSDVKVGQKIFVQGATSGTNVSATSISLGHPGKHLEEANDTDAGSASEASEPAGSSDASDQ